jgi:hypothetical protein
MPKINNILAATLTVFTLILLFAISTTTIVRSEAQSVNVDPTSGSQATVVTVTGNGFGSLKDVAILLVNDTRVVTIDVIETDQVGNFEMTFSVKAMWDNGDYNITAARQDNVYFNASAPFTIGSGEETPAPSDSGLQDTSDPYSEPTVIPTTKDNSGTTLAIIAIVLVAILVPVALLYFRGNIGDRNRRNRGYGNEDPYNQQGPYPYGGGSGYGGQQGYYPQQQYPQQGYPQQYPQSYQNQQYQRPYGGSQYGQPTGYGGYGGGYSRGGYSTSYSSNSQSGRGTRVCPNCRQVVRGGTSGCPYCGTRLM